MRCCEKLARIMARNLQPVFGGVHQDCAWRSTVLLIQPARLHSFPRVQRRINFQPHTQTSRQHHVKGVRHIQTRASWGAPVDWKKAKVVENSKAANNLQRLLVDVGDIASGYSKPGQYIQLKLGDSKPGFFAIASPPNPDSKVLELLVKQQGETAELLCSTSPGGEVDVSPVMGKGFPVDRVPPEKVSTILLFATGSGISPVKALIESGALEIAKREGATLYYGTYNEDSTAYIGVLDEWRAAGINVVNVYSDKKDEYVQDVFLEEANIPDGSKVAAVLCGQKEMCEAVTSVLTDRGVAKENILLNF